MEITFTLSPRLLALNIILWNLVGIAYAVLISKERFRWLPEKATEIAVVIGTVLVLVTSLLSLPWIFVALQALGFACAGLWQLIRSAYLRSRPDRRTSSARQQVAQEAAAVAGATR